MDLDHQVSAYIFSQFPFYQIFSFFFGNFPCFISASKFLFLSILGRSISILYFLIEVCPVHECVFQPANSEKVADSHYHFTMTFCILFSSHFSSINFNYSIYLPLLTSRQKLHCYSEHRKHYYLGQQRDVRLHINKYFTSETYILLSRHF